MAKEIKPGSIKVLQRYKTIDRLLRNSGEPVNINLIWKECNQANIEAGLRTVKKRIILKDIQDLREGRMGVKAPIIDDNKGNYYYEEGVPNNFSLINIPISDNDFKILDESLKLVRQFIGGKDSTLFENSLDNFQKSINREKAIGEQPNIIIEESTNIIGIENIQVLFEKIVSKKTIMLRYKPFGSPTIFEAVSPYLLKEYNGRWFLIGYNHKFDRISNYGLDRIVEIKDSIAEYNKEKIINPKEYFSHIVGVSIPDDGPIEEIILRVFGTQKFYILTKPLHHSQSVKNDTETFVDIEYKLIPNFEFYHKILSLGKNVQIIKPKAVREKIKLLIGDTLKQYE